MSDKTIYDAVVVGSGASGSFAVKELTERGLKVLLLEAGFNISPENDFPIPPRKERGIIERIYRTFKGQHIQARCSIFGTRTWRFFVNDKKNPYTTPKNIPFISPFLSPFLPNKIFTVKKDIKTASKIANPSNLLLIGLKAVLCIISGKFIDFQTPVRDKWATKQERIKEVKKICKRFLAEINFSLTWFVIKKKKIPKQRSPIKPSENLA